jgi:hypothetical protein
LFTYGYFQHAKFIRQNGKDAVEIQFQDRIVMVKGKGLEPLCDALERLAVERIMQSTVGMYGDLQGIAGSTIQEIEGLEFKALEEPSQTAPK